MKRHLFIVLNHGDVIEPLPNVKYDRENYLRFFQSPEGGYWEEGEYTVYDDAFNFSAFRENIQYQRKIQLPYEYIVFVFCGHGGFHNGEKVIQPKAGGGVISLNQIKEACQGIRTLFIADSCLSLPDSSINESRLFNSATERIKDDLYARTCKRLYNKYVLATPANTFTAGFGVSIGESADDNERGGYYSQTLTDTAYRWIKMLKTDQNFQKYDHLSFPCIHSFAAKEVIKITNEKQHPSIEMNRSENQLPFIIVPKLEYEPHLYL